MSSIRGAVILCPFFHTHFQPYLPSGKPSKRFAPFSSWLQSQRWGHSGSPMCCIHSRMRKEKKKEKVTFTSTVIAEGYPSGEWIHVYTDGSQKLEACRSWFLFLSCVGSMAVGKFASNFDGEVAAICEAARVLLNLPVTKSDVSLGLNFGNAGHMFTRHPRTSGRLPKPLLLFSKKRDRAAMVPTPLRCAENEKGRCSGQAKMQYEPANMNCNINPKNRAGFNFKMRNPFLFSLLAGDSQLFSAANFEDGPEEEEGEPLNSFLFCTEEAAF
ncbi:hypothetical protein CEXT_732821 [Caerostris extrusa]|uniref:RNase H type-1 domain-containing protein n=1 Tax=Caerostris extrusa TaxID=172846 RepID=A0AAV4R287_CAEEX|nr:hypothetical protein CEXT_732821 [Caerostris extrusa]